MTMLAVALPWTHRLVDQSPPRGTGSAYCDRPTKLHTTSTASQTGGQPPQQHTVGVEIPIASDAPHCPTSRGFLVWSFFCQGFRQSSKSFVLRQFLCSISKPVSSSRPAV